MISFELVCMAAFICVSIFVLFQNRFFTWRSTEKWWRLLASEKRKRSTLL